MGQGKCHPTMYPGREKLGHYPGCASEDGEYVGVRQVLEVKVTGLTDELYVKSRGAETRVWMIPRFVV